MTTTLSEEMIKVIDSHANNNVQAAKEYALAVCKLYDSKKNR